jgi:predicted nucleic acid-binding protein
MNASPIICMMKAGIIEVLPALFKDIVVPQEVKREILVRGSKNKIGPRFLFLLCSSKGDRDFLHH